MKRSLPVVTLVAGLALPATLSMPAPVAARQAEAAVLGESETAVERIAAFLEEADAVAASQAFERAILAHPDDPALRRSAPEIVTAFMRQRDREGALGFLEPAFERELTMLDHPAAREELGDLASSLVTVYRMSGGTEEILPALDGALTALAPYATEGAVWPGLVSVAGLRGSKVVALAAAGDVDDAIGLARLHLEEMTGLEAIQPESIDVHLLRASAMANLVGVETDAAARNDVFTALGAYAIEHASDDVHGASIASAYANSAMQQIAMSAREDPDRAEGLMAQLRDGLGAIRERNESLGEVLDRFEGGLGRYERSIAATRKQAALVGLSAPAWDAESWLGGPLTPADVEGKVVLFDFWAVWCGPCIRTFPHLRHLQEAYADQGLQIVGVTRAYGYTWDEDASRAVRSKEDVSPQEERAMLTSFLAHHELAYPVMITPEGSTMQESYGVSGIPHVVLVDRQGTVRLVKVGSSEENAEAIEEMIKTLLAEGE